MTNAKPKERAINSKISFIEKIQLVHKALALTTRSQCIFIYIYIYNITILQYNYKQEASKKLLVIGK